MKNHKISLLSSCVLCAVAFSSAAMAESTTSTDSGGPTIHTQSAKQSGDSSPYTLKLQYTGEEWDNSGGRKDGSLYMQNVDAQFAVDTNKAFGWTGGSFFLEGFYNTARSVDKLVDSAQDPSAVDTGGNHMFRLYQAYYKQDLGNTNILAGIYDIETEFGSTKPMDIFFNGAYAWTFTLDQSGVTGPSTYPNTAPAIRVRQKLNDEWSVQGAILDGVSDSAKYPRANTVNFSRNTGAMMIGEADYTPTSMPRTKIMAGYWGYTGKFDDLNSTQADGSVDQRNFGNRGGYIGGATRIYSQTPRRGLDAFTNIGFAQSSVNEIDRSWNFGLNYTGLLDARPTDKLGLAVGVVSASNAYKYSQTVQGLGVDNYETNFELTYRAKINDWLTVQPDAQYFINPNMNPAYKNDFLIGIHFEIGHLFNL